MSDHVRDMSLIRENELLKQKVQWGYQRIASLVSEIGIKDDFIQRLMAELSHHGWGDMHYSNSSPQDPNIVALLEEGGFQYERGPDQSGASSETPGT